MKALETEYLMQLPFIKPISARKMIVILTKNFSLWS